MELAIFTAVISVVFLCIGYYFGYSTKTGQNAIDAVINGVKEVTAKPQDNEDDTGFYDK